MNLFKDSDPIKLVEQLKQYTWKDVGHMGQYARGVVRDIYYMTKKTRILKIACTF